MNLITNDNQCAYKSKRYTMDVIYCIANQFVKNEIRGRSSFDLSKAFGGINRNKLRWILYAKVIPLKPIRKIMQERENNILQGKHDGKLGRDTCNNKGVLHGIPISALLYIIFADGITKAYNQEITPQKTGQVNIESKNLNMAIVWPNHLISKRSKGSISEEKTPAPRTSQI